MGAALAASFFVSNFTERTIMVHQYRKELLTPSGETYVATSPREANDLIFGSGYREVPESGDGKQESTEPAADEPAPSPYAYGGEVSP